MLKRISVCFILTALLCAEVFSAPGVDQSFLNDYVGKNWTTEDGLPGMTVVDLMQDDKGYIYLGTYDGLVRFDGVEFTLYNRAVDEKYNFATAHSVLQDSEGNLWVGHNDEGLSCISPDGSVTKYTVDNGLLNNKVNVLAEDFDHNIWIGTATGLCYMTPNRQVCFPELDRDITEKITVSGLYCDTSGRIWMTTGSNAYIYENSVLKRFGGFKSLDAKEIYDVTQDNMGAFWFSVEPHYAVKVSDGKETVYDLSHDNEAGSVVTDIVQDLSGNMWIGTDKGVVVIHNGNFAYFDSSNGLPDDGVNEILEDDEGNIWLGLNRGGLYKMTRGKFLTVKTDSAINAICEDKMRNLVWLGSDMGLLCYKDGAFTTNKLTELTQGVRIRHVGATGDGEIIVSAFSNDIPQISMFKDGSIKTWSVDDGIAGNRNRVSIKTTKGEYYVGTARGLNVIRRDGKVENLSASLDMSNNYIMWLYEDSENQIWVGTNGGGVYILRDEKVAKHYTTGDGLAGNVIFKIHEEDGAVWIGTGTGLSRLDKETGKFVNFNSLNGLGTDSVFQLLTDFTGTAWMLSNKGIISARMSEMQEVIERTRVKLTVHNYGKADGLNTGGVTSTSCSLKDSSGNLWFTLVDGFAIYSPIRSGGKQRAPRVEVQGYSIDSEHFDYHGEEIIVPPTAKRLSIKYTGITSMAPERVMFRYRLEGFEPDYSDWGSLRTVSYTNIKPGTYKFYVTALNNDGLESEPGMPVIITKLPHIWQRPWFWILIVLAVGLISVLSVRYKIYKMRRYQIVLEKKVEERTQELKVANEKSEKLLLNILPSEVAKELTDHPDKTIAKKFPDVAVLFTDIVNFTKMSDSLSAEKVVTMLNQMVSKFDERARREGIEKIKTIGDAYMAACGLSSEDDGENTVRMIKFAQGLLEDVNRFNEETGFNVDIRVGINCGNLVAGVIGKSKFIYDIWGDTVNVASRMESTGIPKKIHVTEAVFEQTRDLFSYSEGVDVEVKGKGKMRTYFLQ